MRKAAGWPLGTNLEKSHQALLALRTPGLLSQKDGQLRGDVLGQNCLVVVAQQHAQRQQQVRHAHSCPVVGIVAHLDAIDDGFHHGPATSTRELAARPRARTHR